MALDLSDESLGIASPKGQTISITPGKDGPLNLSDDILGVRSTQAQLKNLPTVGGKSLEGPLAAVDLIAGGLWGLGSQAFGGVVAMGRAGAAALAGLPFVETFNQEYNSIAENAQSMYRPITPTGERALAVTGELMEKGLRAITDTAYTVGVAGMTPGPVGQAIGMARMAGVLPPAEDPAAAAIGAAAATMATLGSPTALLKKPTPRQMVWSEFAAKYPETASKIDASAVGKVRFYSSDRSVSDAVSRQVNQALGLDLADTSIPLEQKIRTYLEQVVPGADRVELDQATNALSQKVKALDAYRERLADERGLPAPVERPLGETVYVDEGGTAATPSQLSGVATEADHLRGDARPALPNLGTRISEEPFVALPESAGGAIVTPDQARALDQAFLMMNPDDRAAALGVSQVGQLRLRMEELQRLRNDPARQRETRTLERQFRTEWAKAFPDRNIARRNDALEAFVNFSGRMTYEELLRKVGPPRSKAGQADHGYWLNKERGAIDIDGLDLFIESLRTLPDKVNVPTAALIGSINRKEITKPERDMMMRVFEDYIKRGETSIPRDIIKQRVAAELLPLDTTRTNEYADFGFNRIGSPDYTARSTVILQQPMSVPLSSNHFGVPNYFSHYRTFDTAPLIEQGRIAELAGVSFSRRGVGPAYELTGEYSVVRQRGLDQFMFNAMGADGAMHQLSYMELLLSGGHTLPLPTSMPRGASIRSIVEVQSDWMSPGGMRAKELQLAQNVQAAMDKVPNEELTQLFRDAGFDAIDVAEKLYQRYKFEGRIADELGAIFSRTSDTLWRAIGRDNTIPPSAHNDVLASRFAQAVKDRVRLRAQSLLLESNPNAAALAGERWWQRTLLEANRTAAQEGVSKMRLGDKDTIAKVEGWPMEWSKAVDLAVPENKKALDHAVAMIKEEDRVYLIDTIGYEGIPASATPTGRISLRQAHEGAHGNVRVPELELKLPDGSVGWYRIPDSFWDGSPMALRAETLFDEVRQTAPTYGKLHALYKSYDKLEDYASKQFGAKPVVDEHGNRWLEWDVRPEAANEKIPNFGGRTYETFGGPGKKQRGAIDIEGVDRAAAENIEAAGRAAGKGAARGWAVPDPSDDELLRRTNAAFDRSFKAEEEAQKRSFGDIAKKLRRDVAGHDYDLRVALERAGEYGEKAKDRWVLQNGATMAAKTKMDAINSAIFDDLSSAEKRDVDKMMRLRRIIEIDRYKGVGKHKHPEGITGPEAEAVARRLFSDNQPYWERVYAKTDQIMDAYRDILVRRLEVGLLSDESFNKLIHFDYSPTEFIDILDPMETFSLKGKTVSVRSSGVPFLERGKRGPVVMDSQMLLAEALVRSENSLFKNRTLNSLYELAAQSPDNEIVRRPEARYVRVDKKTGDETLKDRPKGWVPIGVRVEGKQRFLLMREDLAEQFVRRPEAMNETVASFLRMTSGTSLLKATATSYNPSFVIAGLPMDVLHTWLAAGDYSPHVPKAAVQMGVDLVTTFPDALMRKGRYIDALEQGIGAAFLTHESRGFASIYGTETGSVRSQMLPRWDKVKSVLSYVNETADMWVRLAHRERLIKEGMSPEEATARARDRLDFSQGGVVARGADTIIPYTNVAVQSLLKVMQQAKRDPVDFGIKLAWAGGIMTSFYIANMMESPETWKQIPPEDKIKGLPITFGDQFYVFDPDGNKRYLYLTGPRLDASLVPFAAAIVGGLEKAEYGKVPEGIARRTMGMTNPLFDFNPSPAMNGIVTYLTNYDLYTGRPVYTGPAVKPEDEVRTYGQGEPTSPIAKLAADIGMSPARTEAAVRKVINTNNPYISLMGSGLKAMLADVDEREKSKMTLQLLTEVPGMKSVVKLTHPLTGIMEDMEKVEQAEGSRRRGMTSQLDNLMFDQRKGTARIKDIQEFIARQEPADQEWLSQYAQTSIKVKEVMRRFEASDGVPPESWWRAAASLPPRARAQVFWNHYLSANPGDRERVQAIAKSLQKAGAGFYSDEFRRELGREIQLTGEDRR